jgi:hypothetical protein
MKSYFVEKMNGLFGISSCTDLNEIRWNEEEKVAVSRNPHGNNTELVVVLLGFLGARTTPGLRPRNYFYTCQTKFLTTLNSLSSMNVEWHVLQMADLRYYQLQLKLVTLYAV